MKSGIVFFWIEEEVWSSKNESCKLVKIYNREIEEFSGDSWSLIGATIDCKENFKWSWKKGEKEYK